ncbi:MAG: dockerin type I domain-containing protein [Pirellulales bacterium]
MITYSNPKGFVAYDDAVIFAAYSVLSPNEDASTRLWRLDGQDVTPIDVDKGCNTGTPDELVVRDGLVYFSASDAVHGCELWQYDGESARIAADIAPGPVGSYPRQFGMYNGELYFTAFDIEYGGELRKLVTVPDGDCNGDGRVGIADLAVIQRNLGRAADAVYAQGDINGDGAVNAADVAMLVAQFGTSQQVNPSSASAPSGIVVARPRSAGPLAPANRIDAVLRRGAARDAGVSLGGGDADTMSTLRTARRARIQSADATDAAIGHTSFDVGPTRRSSNRTLARR